jgi:hypothetical protein
MTDDAVKLVLFVESSSLKRVNSSRRFEDEKRSRHGYMAQTGVLNLKIGAEIGIEEEIIDGPCKTPQSSGVRS